MEILTQIGIDGKLLLAQAVNFLLLLFLMHRFAYKPMLSFLEKRTERIEKGLRDAEEAEKKLSQAAENEEKVLVAAREESKRIIADAREAAEKRGRELVAEFEKKADGLMKDAEERATEEREKLMREAKAEIAGLVVEAAEKVLREKLSADGAGSVTKFLR